LTVDLSSLSAIPSAGLVFAGQGQGSGTGDTLVLSKGATPLPFSSITHTFTNASDGGVSLTSGDDPIDLLHRLGTSYG
jgi:hypothetical protein